MIGTSFETPAAQEYVAFRVGNRVSNDLRDLLAAVGTREPVIWYTRVQMLFMASTGPQWAQFAQGPALTMEAINPRGIG